MLMESEKDFAGEYAYLDMKATQKNLSMFEPNNLFFNKGYIPSSFQAGQNPNNLVWLHIDLNSALPTLHALNFFWGKLEMGGLILFDDYALPGYQDTQKAVEAWIKSKNGTLLHLPTGQAIFIKDKCAELI
jgi:O-methyltransferase